MSMIPEPDSVVNVTSLSIQTRKVSKSPEPSWKDTLMTNFVDSVGGFGANVETGDFDKASLPFVTPTGKRFVSSGCFKEDNVKTFKLLFRITSENF